MVWGFFSPLLFSSLQLLVLLLFALKEQGCRKMLPLISTVEGNYSRFCCRTEALFMIPVASVGILIVFTLLSDGKGSCQTCLKSTQPKQSFCLHQLRNIEILSFAHAQKNNIGALTNIVLFQACKKLHAMSLHPGP